MAKSKTDIWLKRGERGILIGKTGSGKTQAGLVLLRYGPRDPLYYFDTKNDPEIGKYFNPETTVEVPASGVDSEEAKQAQTVLVRPTGEEMADISIVDEAFDKIYGMGEKVVYIDETSQVAPGIRRMGPGLINLLSRGRSRNLTVLSGTQRPVQIPRQFFTESERFYIFQLGDLRDRKRVFEFVPDVKVLRSVERYHFIYYDHTLEQAISYAPLPMLKPFRPGARETPQRAENYRFL